MQLEEDPECQFSLTELTEKMNKMCDDSTGYTTQYLKSLLQEKYGDRVVFTDFGGKNSVFCFKGKANKFLYESWHGARAGNPESDRQRVVKAAAQIILEDIKSRPYDMDNYFIGDLDEDYLVPDSLRLFMAEMIKSKTDSAQSARCREALAQALMLACRPKSYQSPILLHLAAFMYQKDGKRINIDVLHSLGFGVSYAETKRFVTSLVNGQEPEMKTGPAFMQYAFDNADHNVRTLDGHGTFHNMGGIRCVTPAPSASLPATIPRLKGNVAMDVARGRIAPVHFEKRKSGLKLLDIRDVGVSRLLPSMTRPLQLEALWGASFCVPETLAQGVCLPSWTGFMEVIHAQCGPTDVSQVQYLPFINLDPTNLSCIYTALNFALTQCRAQGQSTCFVTFDQPLFVKATDIVEATDELKSVVVLLGGFHLMSYLGCIGEINSGSGLEDLFATVYAKNALPLIMNGHAYSRAMRAHSLAQLALSVHILKDHLCPNNSLLLDLSSLLEKLMNGDISRDEALDSEIPRKVQNLLQRKCDDLSSQNRTSKLWIEYLFQVQVGHLFMQGIRTGNWELYIDSMKAMLPFFHAAGHLHYAKAVHIFIQKLENLEAHMENHPKFEMFARRGFFSIRHHYIFFKGLSMDLTIEQRLMRHLKTCGLTRGRGITDSMLAQFVAAMPHCVPISQRLEEFTGTRRETTEQHRDLQNGRRKRDNLDLKRFISWLETNSPFEERPSDMLVSLSTGLVADSTVNCDAAWEVGMKSMQAMHGNNFGDVSLKRKDKVKPLSAMSHNITVQGEEININPTQLLHRIICVLNATGKSLSEFMQYELAPKPPSLFDEVSLRKTDKSALATAIADMCPPGEEVPADARYVVDGGMLLRAVVWPRPATYDEISAAYKTHVLRRYGSAATVVFDGYSQSHLSTKAEEQRRRCTSKTSPTLTIRPDITVCVSQTNFLGNGENKTSLIRLLTPVLENAGLSVLQADGDADRLIVEEALRLAVLHRRVVVAATDTDILALLVQRSPTESEIFLHAPGTSGRPPKVYDICQTQKSLESLTGLILFIHAATGCDTTSAFFGKGKRLLLRLLQDNPHLREEAKIFYNPSANKNNLITSGEKIIIKMYNGTQNSLDDLRYALYNKIASTKKLSSEIQLKTLPPTSAAAKQHCLRVYLQVQEWLGNSLEPQDYGWKLQGNPVRLVPVTSELQPAPECLLKVIRCNCKKGCGVQCECRRSGLPCRPMCGTCNGTNCTNMETTMEEEDDDDVVPDSEW